MFAGRKNITLDAQNRISVPSEYREELGNQLYVGIGFDSSYITVYAKPKFQAFIDKLMVNQMENWDEITTLTSMMNDASMDAQGRVTVPADLVKDYQLDREIVVVGGGDHIQIWKTSAWEAYITEQRKTSMKQRFAEKTRNR